MDSDFASTMPDGLLRAFATTEYRVHIGGRELVIQPGRRHDDLDDAVGQRDWAIVTAFNPQARRIDEDANGDRHRNLIEAVRSKGWEAHPAVNRDPSGHWPDELSLLIVEASPRDLDSLAESFGQAAIVTGHPGTPARLRLYGSGWPQPLPDWTELVYR